MSDPIPRIVFAGGPLSAPVEDLHSLDRLLETLTGADKTIGVLESRELDRLEVSAPTLAAEIRTVVGGTGSVETLRPRIREAIARLESQTSKEARGLQRYFVDNPELREFLLRFLDNSPPSALLDYQGQLTTAGRARVEDAASAAGVGLGVSDGPELLRLLQHALTFANPYGPLFDISEVSRTEPSDLEQPGSFGSTMKNLGMAVGFKLLLEPASKAGMQWRMVQYAGFNPRLLASVDRMYELFDVGFCHGLADGPKAVGGAAFFQSDLKQVLARSDAVSFLAEVSGAMEAAVASNLSFNLWDFTREQAGSDEEAIRWLAVLFQDTAGVFGIGYAANAELVPSHSIRQWDRAITLLRRHGSTWQLYPPAVDSSRPNVYRFYNLAFVAQRNREIGSARGDDKAMQVALFLFNYEYEMFFLEQQETLLGMPANPLRARQRPLMPIRDDGYVADVYLGYLGATFKSGSRGPRRAAHFETGLRTAPKPMVQGLVREILPRSRIKT